MLTTTAVFGTIAGAIVAWAASVWWRSRALWTLGAILMVIHSIGAFALFYGWSHATAIAATAAQTEAMTGMASGGGLYLNYLFLAVWVLDAAWWWVAPASYEARPRAIEWLVHGFLFFMFVNGAVVFADGAMRIVGSVAVMTVGVAWWIRRYRPAFPAA